MMREDLIPLLSAVQKPGRYTGGEFNEIVKDPAACECSVAFCFPDTYEIGMSNLGMRILYGVLNETEGVRCERVYAPWTDMEDKMRESGIPLFTQESGGAVGSFDIVAFTLQYELCYTNVLNMLDLAGIPLLASERGEDAPVVLGGGPCAYNSEPVADFFDIFSIGEGEEALPELCRLYISMKRANTYTKSAFLREASHIEGFYVPSLYDVAYNDDGTVASYTPKYPDVPPRVRKRIVADFDRAYTPLAPVVPYIETVHDRVMLETFRGCIRGCRFCQAGMVYRPVREKSAETLDAQAKLMCANTGYNEISLSSLSISDYSQLHDLTGRLLEWTDDAKISLSLPSLRADSFSDELMQRISTVRSSSLTFAPEAGTQRLRDAINKNVTEEDIMGAVSVAFAAGKSLVKLYFMNGLPTETDEDVKAIPELAHRVVSEYYRTPNRNKAKPPSVTASVAVFVPKPFTPFQWEAQPGLDEIERRQKLMYEANTDRKVRLTWHDARVSRIEAVFARGDRRLSKALLAAHSRGMRFDAWDDYFSYDAWIEVFDECGIDPAFYANREMGDNETLPWDVIDCGVTKEFLLRERHKSRENATTKSCAEACSGCGANTLGGELRWCPNCTHRN
jgi:radical SAM family uncharacterized protein